MTRTTKMADGVDNKSQILVRIEEVLYSFFVFCPTTFTWVLGMAG